MAACCPICDESRGRVLATLTAGDIRRCEACGHRFVVAVRQAIYDDGYAGFDADPLFRARVGTLLDEVIEPLVPPPAALLDLGCGNGAFLEVAHQAGYPAVGIDTSQAGVQICHQRGLQAFAGDFETMAIPGDGSFDVATMWDVLEHLPQPAPFLRRAFAALRPGGYLVAKVPHNTDRTMRLARLAPRMGGPLLHLPSHVQFFSPETLGRLAASAGFPEVDLRSVAPMRAQRTQGSLRKRTARLILTRVHAFGGDGNLLLVARKPS